MTNTLDRIRTCIRGIRNPLPRPLGYESALCEKLPTSHIIRTFGSRTVNRLLSGETFHRAFSIVP